MLVVSPTEAEPTTATTPTPIGCKLLKINLLAPLSAVLRVTLRSEKLRILQTRIFPSTLSEN
jgi:hypothetical protein